jgi:nucleotide-binding universal stress UspA family protein
MKDILVVVTGGPHDELRLASAAEVAGRFQAALMVAVVNELPDLNIYAADPAAGIAPIYSQLREEAEVRGKQLREATEKRLAELFPGADVVALNEYGPHVGESVAALARLNDIFITTLPAESSKPEVMNAILDKVLVEGACGILCLPDRSARVARADHAVLAWNNTREASRAMQDALPLMMEAKKVTVLLIDQPLRRAGASFRPGDEIMARLQHHGISPALVRVASEGLSTAEAIVAEIHRLGADLLVMGAQAEGGMRQWFAGSTSRKVLAEADFAMLIAH